MSNKSDLVLTCMLMAFFAYFMFNLPDSSVGFQNTATQNASTFANTLATDYNAANLSQIAPAAGDETPKAQDDKADDKIAVPPAPAAH